MFSPALSILKNKINLKKFIFYIYTCSVGKNINKFPDLIELSISLSRSLTIDFSDDLKLLLLQSNEKRFFLC